MRLLVLGGTRFVGRALVADALSRGWQVSALTRGVTGALPEGVEPLLADRLAPGALEVALGRRGFDLVVDTWAEAPRVCGTAATALADRCDGYGYVSSISVYEWGRHTDESSPLVEGDPDADVTDYAADKRGAELAVLRAVPDALLVRSGLVLGPHEDVGRLPWWLSRIARGGRVVAPGRPERPLQYVDARDLAAFTLDALVDGRTGPVDTASPSGHATTGSLLEACVDVTGSGAQLVWIDDVTLAAAGAEPWTGLPVWVPETGVFAGFLEGDTARAASWGLRCRPITDTVRDTWDWLVRDGLVEQPPARVPHGLPPETERVLLEGRSSG